MLLASKSGDVIRNILFINITTEWRQDKDPLPSRCLVVEKDRWSKCFRSDEGMSMGHAGISSITSASPSQSCHYKKVC